MKSVTLLLKQMNFTKRNQSSAEFYLRGYTPLVVA